MRRKVIDSAYMGTTRPFNAENKSIFWNEEGFSTIGSAVALLLTLSLLFTTARIYEINTASAAIQEVADASVLSAENVVAEFYTLAVFVMRWFLPFLLLLLLHSELVL